MIISDNRFFLSSTAGVVVERPASSKWIFQVSENGFLQGDFLQVNGDLDISVLLNGIDAKCELNCGYLLNDNNKINIKIHVEHKCSKTISNQQIRGLATGNGEACFNGTITIPHNSQKCDGHQNHRAVILSDTARVLSVPQLEIWADDVKCAHGSAIGPLNKEQLFYLQTRGLTESQARKILLSSFFNHFSSMEFDGIIQDWMAHYV
ncbi:MAG: SufD family Fe-S cluster assembly protein [Alphaproteobacteria bacterium]|nr:SufD family Fe-S cluster assembly protein [Alphaproteobacteria bacterium]